MWSALAIAVLLLLQAPDYNAEGIEALEEERYENAAAAFEKVLEADPEDYSALFYLAFIDSIQGNSGDAIAGYREVLKLKPGLYEAELNLGILLLSEDQAESALAPLTEAVEERPDEFRPNFYLAESFLATEAYSEAEDYYRRALALNREDAASQLGLARSVAAQDRLDEAELHYREAAALDPRYTDALREIALAYEESEKLSAAISIYSEFPDDVALQERRGELLLELDRNGEAINCLEQVVASSPTPANQYALAIAYIREEELPRAEPLLRRVLQEEPTNFELRMTYGRVLRDERKFAPAAAEFQRLTQQQPYRREAWSELASVLMLIEDYPRAVAALDRAEELGEDPGPICFVRAVAHDRSREYEAALNNYERFLELSDGGFPNKEFQARQRIRVILRELGRN